MTVLNVPDLRSTLPGRYYTSPAMLTIEKGRILLEVVAMCRKGRLADERRPSNGPTESAEFRSIVRCAYHGWAYGLDGRLLAAPNLPEMPGFVKARHGLRPVRLATWAGYVRVCLDDEADSLAAQVEPQLL